MLFNIGECTNIVNGAIMLKLDINSKSLEKIEPTDMQQEKLLERYDLQKLIVSSWEVFKNEIGLPASFLIGQEIKPHDSVSDSIDLLAYNQDDSSLIVIELKRDKNKLQLLQSISYAGMVYTWTRDDIISEINKNKIKHYEEARGIVENSDFNNDIKIVLLAESFDPEVIMASDWLKSVYGVDITAFAINLHKIDKSIMFDIEQRYPLKELSETYESRRKKAYIQKSESNITWNDIIPKLKYSFGAKAIELCLKFQQGDPKRRRFGTIRSNYDGFKWISINFRENYINLYTFSKNKESGSITLKKIFGEDIDLIEWQDGWSLIIDQEEKYQKLVSWLKLE